jgi:hypothetical protein
MPTSIAQGGAACGKQVRIGQVQNRCRCQSRQTFDDVPVLERDLRLEADAFEVLACQELHVLAPVVGDDPALRAHHPGQRRGQPAGSGSGLEDCPSGPG